MHKEDEKIDILVVDDTIDNIKLLDSLLTYEGYNVTGASSGNAAIRICQKQTSRPNFAGYYDAQNGWLSGLQAVKVRSQNS